ncbi:MAG TPA: DUF4012 domain-containing protein [Patescibacteria group bacterium]|nr:DUF4012 domain-containing protein [Patescibacteria group bacterium]
MDIHGLEHDFSLASDIQPPSLQSKRTKFVWYIIGAIGAFLILICVIAGIEVFSLMNAIKKSAQAKQMIERSLEQASVFDFADAHLTLETGKGIMENAQKQVEGVRVLRVIPWVGTQVRGADGLLTAGVYALDGIDRAFVWASDIPFKTQGETVVSIDPEKSKKAFSRLLEFPSLVIMVNNLFVQALDTLDALPKTGVVSEISDSQKTLRSQITLVEKTLSQYVPLAQTLPHVSGVSDDKSYLWILMNNDELRPTGGYISAYAYTNFSDGALKEFFVDNSRNLDTGITATSKKAPLPIQKYDTEHGLGEHWLFHDASWSPDYPTAVQDIMALFTEQTKKQGKELKKIDGVVAITPSFVGKFLMLTGPVDVQGYRIDATNVSDVLEIDAHRGFRERGLSEEQRKQLIFDLGTTLLRTLGKRGVNEWSQIVSTFEQGMNEKHMMVFHADEAVQGKVREKGWDGSIAQQQNDYLMVADANLGSFKSDIGVDRTIEYSADLTGNQPSISVTINYQNKNTLMWKTRPVYRTYTRVYAPQGARLIGSIGIDQHNVDVAQELQKTSFGMLVELPIGRKKTITLTYVLPSTALKAPYSLMVQKQPGTQDIPLKVEVVSPRPLNILPQKGERLSKDKMRYEYDTRLRTDQTYTFSF